MGTQKGQYKRKHSDSVTVDPQIAEAISRKAVDGMITCVDAYAISSSLQKTMIEIGIVLDLTEISITKCQLGLFGYSPNKRILLPAQSVDDKLRTAIMSNIKKGCMPCHAIWEIAEVMALSKIEVASACEAMAIKIKPCQLGAF